MLEPYYTELVGRGSTFRQLQQFIRHASGNAKPILLLGEAGAGKEITARSIHLSSSRRNHPFLVVDCSLYYEKELERELFGEIDDVEEVSRRGILEFSHRGTCYLGNVEEIGPSLQERLFNYLETGYLQRVGSDKPIPSRVRLIFSSDKDLEGFSEGGLFLRPLWERMVECRFDMPPLRHHPEDIRPFVSRLMQLYALENDGSGEIEFSASSWEALEAYPWPGNYDELKKEVLRAFRSGARQITPETLAPQINSYWQGQRWEPDVRRVVDEIEEMIREFKLMMRLDAEYGSVLIDEQEWDFSLRLHERV